MRFKGYYIRPPYHPSFNADNLTINLAGLNQADLDGADVGTLDGIGPEGGESQAHLSAGLPVGAGVVLEDPAEVDFPPAPDGGVGAALDGGAPDVGEGLVNGLD